MEERLPCQQPPRFIPPERGKVAVIDAANGAVRREEPQPVSPFQPRRIAPLSSDGGMVLGG
jgi:hypothetical protein